MERYKSFAMFQSFDAAVDLSLARRRVMSLGVALFLTALASMVSARLLHSEPVLQPKKNVDVAFRPPAPLPPKPKLEVLPKPKPPPVKVEAPKPSTPAAMVAPTEVPLKPVPEADKPQVEALALAPGGTGTGHLKSNADDDEDSEPEIAAAQAKGPIQLPEEAEPPEADEENVMPEFPESARAAGTESVVILKVVIEKDGRVGKVQVLKGEEPFLAAALEAVRQWRYSPALLDGQPLAVYRIVKIPFRIRS